MNQQQSDDKATDAERAVLLADFNSLTRERRAVVMRTARDLAIGQARSDADRTAVEAVQNEV